MVLKIAAASVLFLAVASASGQNDFPFKHFTKSPTEHVINRIDEPFVVRSVHGFITSPGVRQPFQEVLFEIQGLGQDKTIRKALTNKKGEFRIKVEPGTYYFKATSNGFQSVIGTITISKRAKKSSLIKIEMRRGV